MSGAVGSVLGGVVEVVGLNLAKGKIIIASFSSVDSLYPGTLPAWHMALKSVDKCITNGWIVGIMIIKGRNHGRNKITPNIYA